jgi:hypothetical protein
MVVEWLQKPWVAPELRRDARDAQAWTRRRYLIKAERQMGLLIGKFPRIFKQIV